MILTYYIIWLLWHYNEKLRNYLCPHFPTNKSCSSFVDIFSTFCNESSDSWLATDKTGLRYIFSRCWSSLIEQLGQLIDDVHVPNSLSSAHLGQEQLKYHCSLSFCNLSARPKIKIKVNRMFYADFDRSYTKFHLKVVRFLSIIKITLPNHFIPI